jgi:hypothetical protein
LRIGDAGVERKARHAAPPFFHADDDVPDLRPVAMGNDDRTTTAEDGFQVIEGFGGVLELLRDGPRFPGPCDGVAAERDYQGLRLMLRMRSPDRPS